MLYKQDLKQLAMIYTSSKARKIITVVKKYSHRYRSYIDPWNALTRWNTFFMVKLTAEPFLVDVKIPQKANQT